MGARLTTPKRITIMGDVGVGKTSLVMAFQGILYASSRILRNPVEFTVILEHQITEELKRIKTDVVLICFALDSEQSFEAVRTFALTVKETWPQTRMYLIGLKSDTKNLRLTRFVCEEHCTEMRREIGAIQYFGCSVKHFIGVKEILRAIV